MDWSVERMKKKIRTMSYSEKLELLDWLNVWWEYQKGDEQ